MSLSRSSYWKLRSQCFELYSFPLYFENWLYLLNWFFNLYFLFLFFNANFNLWLLGLLWLHWLFFKGILHFWRFYFRFRTFFPREMHLLHNDWHSTNWVYCNPTVIDSHLIKDADIILWHTAILSQKISIWKWMQTLEITQSLKICDETMLFIGSKWVTSHIPVNFDDQLFGFGLADWILFHICSTVELKLHLCNLLEFFGLKPLSIPKLSILILVVAIQHDFIAEVVWEQRLLVILDLDD